jgi:hypothetical protein
MMILIFPKIHYQYNILLIQTTLQDGVAHNQPTHSSCTKLWRVFSIYSDMLRSTLLKGGVTPFLRQGFQFTGSRLRTAYQLHSLCSDGRHERALSCGELENMEEWSWPISSYCIGNSLEGLQPPCEKIVRLASAPVNIQASYRPHTNRT